MAAGRRRHWSMETRASPTFASTGRPKRSWAKNRKTGSWSGCAPPTPHGRFGTIERNPGIARDPQNLPAGLTRPWPGAGYAGFGDGDLSNAYTERAEIYDFVRDRGITGLSTIAGDRHSFWAGYASRALPPGKFEPVGVAFITGSLSAPGLAEAFEHILPKDHPLRPLFLADLPGSQKPLPAVNLLLRHGVRACLEFQKSGSWERASAVSNPDLSPHLAFVDMGGHGYSVVRASARAFEVEFVCIPRPLERSERADGGPLVYRVTHTAALWRPASGRFLRGACWKAIQPHRA